MLCLKKRRTYSFTQGVCAAIPRRSKKDNNNYEKSFNMTIMTLPRKNRSKEERPSRMVLTVTEDTPADMLAGSMELLVQLPRDQHTQRVTVLRSTPMMDLLVQIATAHKLTASNYTLQAIGEHGLVLSHHPNTPIGALDVLQVKLLPKQGTCVPRKTKQANQPFETTFRLQVHLPRNQLYVSRVSPKMNLGEILDEVCREKNLDKNNYELRHPANLEETLDLSLSLQDYHLQEVTLYAKQAKGIGPTLSTQDIMALQRQEERRRQQTKQSVFGFMFKKSKENSLSTDSLGGRSVSPARSDETARSASPLQPPTRPQRKRRPAPKPPTYVVPVQSTSGDSGKDKMVINHSRNSSDSSGYHEASVLSDNPDLAARLPETLPRRSKTPGMSNTSRKLAQTSQSSKSLSNLVMSGATLSRGISNTSLSSTGLRKKRIAPPPPTPRPLSSAISTQALERIVDSEESLTSDMDPSKPPSDIGAPSKASSDIDCPKANSDIVISTKSTLELDYEPKSEAATYEFDDNIEQNRTAKTNVKACSETDSVNYKLVKTDVEMITPVEVASKVEQARVVTKKGNQDVPSETDILLQKVSDTLSNVLPVSSSPIPASSSPVPETLLPLKTNHTTASMETDVIILNDSTIKSEFVGIKDESNEIYKSCTDLPENTLSTSTPNMTATGLQENTSDYVSAISEDLSISDWEYQLPAPPTAFRDSHSPVFDDYDTVTLGSVEAFKEPLGNSVSELANTTDSNKNIESTKNLLNSSEANFEFQEALNEKMDFVPEAEIDKQILNKSVEQTSVVSRKTKANSNLRKEIISELENKIETGTLTHTINKDFDRKNMNNLSAPEIAPVDNTLSNFTITTYTKQNSLDIFEEFEESSGYARNSDDRFIKTFATLSRNKADSYDKSMTNMHLINNISHDKKTHKSNANNLDCKSEPKNHNQDELIHRLQSLNATNEKTNIQRSKSYISISSNAKYQTETQKIGERKHESQVEQEISGIKKSTSITDLNVDVLRGNEKFSQWRDNILKFQKEPSKEKQLQSLQVLKSILPQLKNVQQAEENMSKEYSSALLTEKRYESESNEQSIKMSVSTRESQDSECKQEPECKQLSKEKNIKRYVYTGPPAISLGSWSERPSINVQIKMDTDYKLGGNNTNSSKTVVNINSTKNEKDFASYVSNVNKNNIAKQEIKINSSANKNPDELTKKLITHTTASGFKTPMSSRINMIDSTKDKDRPFVMGVELKKTSIEMPKEISKNNENEIDTSINFRELTNTFAQHMKQKPKRANINYSSNSNIQMDKIEKAEEPNVKQNGHAKFAKVPNQNDLSSKSQFYKHDTQGNAQIKKFTSVVGVNGTSQNFRPQNETSLKCNINNFVKINPPMPVVKGFKIPITESKVNNNEIKHELSTIDGSSEDMHSSKFPTMPVIMGVTLKNANAKSTSVSVQLDSRDTLLESIRNFGGREKLKSIAGRY
ncbi:putative mediator of RNA polymerase II transcription subunit 26 isoform X3 [Cataglyphis hispanica]|uniref:putative mediator of RNA polymerase II transcription subunit 26 isoform X3 n=1 Tax=Cataglyphis hispanica TaxID=1086592 RepID=UPI0021802602|nr:putative mediator of RNA polymerase II transcription subunit 26 isoform X3 [Cataglyphis hispanica]